MTAYYNDAKDGVGYSNINPKWDEANLTFIFDEAIIKKMIIFIIFLCT